MFYIFVVLVSGYFLVKELWMRWNYDLHKIPAPPTVPIFGQYWRFVSGSKPKPTNLWLQEWREKLRFPKLMRFCSGGTTSIYICDINLLRSFTFSKSGLSHVGSFFHHFQRLVMGNDPMLCMVATPSVTPYTKAIRRSYTESASSEGLRQAFYRQTEVMPRGKLYIEENQNQETIDVQDFLGRLMLNVAGKAELNVDFDGLEKTSCIYTLLRACGQHMWSLSSVPFLEKYIKLFPNSKLAKKINKDHEDLLQHWTRIANDICNKGEPDDSDFTIGANLRKVLIPGTNKPLPFNLLRGELATSIIGGFDTTGHQISWIFALLAENPSAVDKILDELRTHGLYGEGARDMEFEDLNELEYLTAAVKEGMRMIHTVLIVSGKALSEDFVLGGFRLPKGTVLYTCSNSTMNCEQEWEDHLAFKPERWIHEKNNNSEKYYVPFGIGERSCVGIKLAMQYMKVAIVYLFTRFSFELVGDTVKSLVENGVAGVGFEARNGINMKITMRTKK
eukprot:g347.t1